MQPHTTITSSLPSSSRSSIRSVRPLVPFFIPGADIVNETLVPYQTPSPNHSSKLNHSNPVTLSVRQWDHDEGFFKDAIQVVQDGNPNHTQQPLQQQHNSNNNKSRLLTPANIRAARELARRREEEQASNSSTNVTQTKVTSNVASTSTTKKQRSKQSNHPNTRDRHRERRTDDYYQTNYNKKHSQYPQQSPNQNKQRMNKPKLHSQQEQTTPESKPRPFAGSTFETASPPPSGLPIPGFIAKMAAASPPSPQITVSSNTEHSEQERAAVELRRMLKI